MIYANSTPDGTIVNLEGDIFDLIEEITSIIHSAKEDFTERYPKEVVDKIITLCGEMAYADEDDIEGILKDFEKTLERIIDCETNSGKKMDTME